MTVETVSEVVVVGPTPTSVSSDAENSSTAALDSAADIRRDKSILSMFRGISRELDDRNDKYERIGRISRDITIESKRIIFLLHRYITEPDALEEAESRLRNLRQTSILDLARELEHEDIFYFLRAFTPGMQEYIEAAALYHFFKQGKLVTHAEIEKELVFEVVLESPGYSSSNKSNRPYSSNPRGGRGGNYHRGRGNYNNNNNRNSEEMKSQRSSATTPMPEPTVPVKSEEEAQLKVEESKVVVQKKTLALKLPQTDYVLGILDLTGELMRNCIAATSGGDSASAAKSCHFVQHFYKGIIGVWPLRKDFQFKNDVLLTSLKKMEFSCYQLCIREKPEDFKIPSSIPKLDEEDVDSGLE